MGGWGTFLGVLFFLLFPCSIFSRDRSPVQEVASDCCAAFLRSPEQLSALRCLWELKTFHVLQNQTLSDFLSTCKCWLSVRFWLVHSVYPNSCLWWSPRSSQSLPVLWIVLIPHCYRLFLILFLNFILWKAQLKHIN